MATALPAFSLPGSTPPPASSTTTADTQSKELDAETQARIREALAQHEQNLKDLAKRYQGDKAGLNAAIAAMQKQQAADIKREDQLQSQMLGEEKQYYFNLSKITAPQAPDMLYKAKSFKTFLPIALAFAAIGTLETHGDIAVGMQALAGGLNGYRQGNEAEYARNWQTWHAKMQDAIEGNRQRLQVYRDWIAKAQRDGTQHLQANMEILRTALTNLRDDVSLGYMANGSLSDIVGGYSKLDAAHTKFVRTVDEVGRKTKPASPKELAEYAGAVENSLKLVGFSEDYDRSSPEYLQMRNKLEQRAYQIRQEHPNLSPGQAAMQAVTYAQEQHWFEQIPQG